MTMTRSSSGALVAALLLAAGCAKSSAVESPPGDGTTGTATAGSADEGCPKDLLKARGTSCSTEGKTCRAGTGDVHRLLMCSRGQWSELNVPPAPLLPPPPAG